jgi:hypothetical protein
MKLGRKKIVISERDEEILPLNPPAWMPPSLIENAKSWGVARQSLVKMWLAERMSRRES